MPNSDHLFMELSTHKTVCIVTTTANRYHRVLLALCDQTEDIGVGIISHWHGSKVAASGTPMTGT